MKKETIAFHNYNEAEAVFPPVKAKPEEIITALGINPHKPVITIIGGAASIDESLTPRLIQLFSRGIARAAAETNAIIIDGGTQSGVMAMMGQGVADRGHKSTLLGVAPVGLVTYPGGPEEASVQLDPNHSHFVLVEGNAWGSETATMYKLVKELTKEARGVAILAGGGKNSIAEAIQAIRQNLSLIVIEGSGGLADEIAEAWKNRATLPEAPLMAEIIEDGEIHLYSLSNSVKGLQRIIIRELGGDSVLAQAWGVFADYDLNANIQQKRFHNMQISILMVGIMGTALTLILEVFGPRDATGKEIITAWDPWWALRKLLIIVPILLTVLVTAANRFKQGNKWLLLRAGAEAIKREIYCYRTRAMYYHPRSAESPPEQELSKRVEFITKSTMQTEVNTSALVPYNKSLGFPPYMYATQGKDDGFSFLTPDRYVEVRLNGQLNYFQKRSIMLDRQLKLFQWLILIIGGVGTYLVAVNQQVWIALTTSVVAAMTTFLGYRQTEETLTNYNQAATDLAKLKAWWNALSPDEQEKQKNVDTLIDSTERVLESELTKWSQKIQNVMAELRNGQLPSDNKRHRELDEKVVRE